MRPNPNPNPNPNPKERNHYEEREVSLRGKVSLLQLALDKSEREKWRSVNQAVTDVKLNLERLTEQKIQQNESKWQEEVEFHKRKAENAELRLQVTVQNAKNITGGRIVDEFSPSRSGGDACLTEDPATHSPEIKIRTPEFKLKNSKGDGVSGASPAKPRFMRIDNKKSPASLTRLVAIHAKLIHSTTPEKVSASSRSLVEEAAWNNC